MRKLRIGAAGFGYDLLCRTKSYGVEVLSEGPFPDYPFGVSAPVKFDFGGMGDIPHICEHEPWIVIPALVVFDVVVRATGGCRFCSSTRFKPYWLGPVTLRHWHVPPPDLAVWRRLVSPEALSLLAENPWLGSVRFFTTRGDVNNTAQAYVQEQSIVVETYGSASGHHAAYTRWDTNAPRLEMVGKPRY